MHSVRSFPPKKATIMSYTYQQKGKAQQVVRFYDTSALSFPMHYLTTWAEKQMRLNQAFHLQRKSLRLLALGGLWNSIVYYSNYSPCNSRESIGLQSPTPLYLTHVVMTCVGNGMCGSDTFVLPALQRQRVVRQSWYLLFPVVSMVLDDEKTGLI